MVSLSAPLISVIVPTYNRAWSLPRALDSLRTQTWRPLEVIVVDDGSEDNTPAVLTDMAERLERAGAECRLFCQENQGVSAARNRGLESARGEWLALLDSDDVWLPGKLESQMADLADKPGFEMGQTGEIWIRGGHRVNPPQHLKKMEGDLFAQSLRHCAISPSSVLWHRSLYERYGGFDTRYPACEDYALWLKMTVQEPVALLSEALILKYGGHEDQLSATVPALDRFRLQAIQEVMESGKLRPDQYREALAVFQKKASIYGLGCAKRGRPEEARRWQECYEGLKKSAPDTVGTPSKTS